MENDIKDLPQNDPNIEMQELGCLHRNSQESRSIPEAGRYSFISSGTTGLSCKY